MGIEAIIIEYLAERIDIPVSGDRPTPLPEMFITVEKTGSYERDYIKTATIAIQSWAGSRYEASVLNDLVKENMRDLCNVQPDISRSHCETDYNFTDEQTKRFRYQAVFEIVYNN